MNLLQETAQGFSFGLNRGLRAEKDIPHFSVSLVGWPVLLV